MDVGDFVWNHKHGVIRFGTITEKKVDPKGWALFTVDWHPPPVMWEEEPLQTWFRVDELHQVDPVYLMDAVLQRRIF